MSKTAVATPADSLPKSRFLAPWIALRPGAAIVLTPCVLLLHGYHPFADDAGIYVAGVEKLLQPTLFQHDAAFVMTHTRYSVFSHWSAWLIERTHVSLETGLIALHLLSVILFLFGCLRVAENLFASPRMQWGALLAACALFALPVAATGLSVMDAYLTARSFSMPFSLLAVAACLEEKWGRCALWLALAGAMHPLMAMYPVGLLLAYLLVRRGGWPLPTMTFITGLFIAGILSFATRRASLPYGYKDAVLSRDYFFLSNWLWYQWMGLIIPLLMLLLACGCLLRESRLFALCAACAFSGGLAVVCCACFVHKDTSYVLARIQMLRTFQLIYAIGILLLGAFVAKYCSGKLTSLGWVLLLACAGSMRYAASETYTSSVHIEWPWSAPANPWQQAFQWIRGNVPADAVFALDPGYTRSAGEDAQSFRAISLHSMLADEQKDGGVAAIFPALAPIWRAESNSTAEINTLSDAERGARLRGTPATWLVLNAASPTALLCPYRNGAVQVCRLR